LKWYEGRKRPTLQIKILELLVTGQRLTVSMADDVLKKHHHSDIWKGFRNLENRGLIKESKLTQEERVKAKGRGNPRKYYQITEDGLYALILVAETAEKFWRAMIIYFHRRAQRTNPDEFKELYETFVNKHLKYLSRSKSTMQLDEFDELTDVWFKNIINISKKITPDQKFLEVLAMNRATTFEQIARYTGKPVREDQIKPIMPRYTNIYPKISHDDNSSLDSEASDNNEYYNSDQKFHRLVITRYNDKTRTTTYELSLFGVMLVLSLIMYNYMGTLKNGLYSDDLSPDTIVLNYSDKLPLIFGRSRWKLLKRKLKQLAFYNFAVIFDKKVLSESFYEPYLITGKQELYDSAIKIAEYRKKQLTEFRNEFNVQYVKYRKEINRELTEENPKETAEKLAAIFLLGMRTLSNLPYGLSIEIDTLDKAFAEEVSFLYYLSLYDNKHFPGELYYSAAISKSFNTCDLPSISPINILSTIIKKDNQVRMLFSSWIQDIMNYQRETLKTIEGFCSQMGIKN
jgi:predicted transcriptional regulator